MKHRFYGRSKTAYIRNVIITIAIFAVVLMLFWMGATRAMNRNLEEQRSTLETAINRSVMHCYAIEGSYPESLDYLKENYGLMYNENLFIVQYRPLGANILPDVTIIERKTADE